MTEEALRAFVLTLPYAATVNAAPVDHVPSGKRPNWICGCGCGTHQV